MDTNQHRCLLCDNLFKWRLGKCMQGFDVKCAGTVKMLIDLELLAHSDYLVATDHSKWSRILQYMRYVLYGEQHTETTVCMDGVCP